MVMPMDPTKESESTGKKLGPEIGAGDSTRGGSRLGIVTDPGESPTSSVPGAANKDRVNFGYITGLMGTADRYEATGMGRYETGRGVETTVYDAQKYLGDLRAKANAPGASEADVTAYNNVVSALKSYTRSDFKTVSGEDEAWSILLKDAAGNNINAMDLLQNFIGRPVPGGSGSGGGGYSGPKTSVTFASERDLRATADAVASTVIGRGITDEEFNKVLRQVREAERNEPTVSIPGVGSSVTRAGLSAEGRQDVIRESLMKGPEAEDYSKATTMMDVFYRALESRPEGA